MAVLRIRNLRQGDIVPNFVGHAHHAIAPGEHRDYEDLPDNEILVAEAWLGADALELDPTDEGKDTTKSKPKSKKRAKK